MSQAAPAARCERALASEVFSGFGDAPARFDDKSMIGTLQCLRMAKLVAASPVNSRGSQMRITRQS